MLKYNWHTVPFTAKNLLGKSLWWNLNCGMLQLSNIRGSSLPGWGWCDWGSWRQAGLCPWAAASWVSHSSGGPCEAPVLRHSSGPERTPELLLEPLGVERWWRWSRLHRNAPYPPGRRCWQCSLPHNQTLFLKWWKRTDYVWATGSSFVKYETYFCFSLI